ncbi:MAG: hypothetical protein ACT4PP_06620 [Sporichthyaceae bacterium]
MHRHPVPTLTHVLRSAARLQELVPDAVLVGGSAAALHAHHRDSFDHDHALADLRDRFDLVLEALEASEGWVTNRVTPGKIILGGIETGVRQMIRRRPLETAIVELPGAGRVVVPTAEETLRIKAFLIVRRNQTRDYLDVAAIAELLGIESASAVLRELDTYYADQHAGGDGVASQVARQLAEPSPRNRSVTRELARYRNLDPRWHEWPTVVAACRALAVAMVVR